MNNFRKIISLLLLMAVFIVSCDKDSLNTKPLDKISSAATWADGPLSEAFVFNVYSFLGYGGFEEQALAGYTDEAIVQHGVLKPGIAFLHKPFTAKVLAQKIRETLGH